jgi:hypothetical protein
VRPDHGREQQAAAQTFASKIGGTGDRAVPTTGDVSAAEPGAVALGRWARALWMRNAPVKILQPNHTIFSFPNKITAEDFKGWVQERNLYNFSTNGSEVRWLAESHDAGESENNGGLVVADVGKGKYVYCSYSLFPAAPGWCPGCISAACEFDQSASFTLNRLIGDNQLCELK